MIKIQKAAVLSNCQLIDFSTFHSILLAVDFLTIFFRFLFVCGNILEITISKYSWEMVIWMTDLNTLYE